RTASVLRSHNGHVSVALGPSNGQRGENRASEQKLRRGRERPFPVPSQAVVKDLPSAGPQGRKDVLEVRSRARDRAERRRIEGASPRGEKSDARDTGPDLEPGRVKVSVRNAVAREVQSRP